MYTVSAAMYFAHVCNKNKVHITIAYDNIVKHYSCGGKYNTCTWYQLLCHVYYYICTSSSLLDCMHYRYMYTYLHQGAVWFCANEDGRGVS